MSVEVSNDVPTEIESSTTEQVESVASEVPSESSEPAVASPAAEQAAVAAAYAANYKYSVRGQEKEIDEMFRPLIKDADTEKKIKELFEKAEGIDFVKQDRESLKKEYTGFKDQIRPYMTEYHKFTSFRDQGNLAAAFHIAGISDDQVFQYALQKLELDQNPNQAKLYQDHTKQTIQSFDTQAQLEHYRMQEEQQRQNSFLSEIDSAINSVSDVAKIAGGLDAFKDEVIAHGMLQHQRGNELSIAQAVEHVANKYRPFLQSTQQTPAAPVPQAQPAAPARPATIPNLGNSNVSAIKTKPRSIDDLKKLSREMDVG